MATKQKQFGKVFAVPLAKDGTIMEKWEQVGFAYSESGAVKAVQKAGFRVVRKGGLIQFGYTPGAEEDAWSVTVKGE